MLINIWVTTRCNFQCKYCYEGEHKQGTSMTEETAKNIVNFIIHNYKNLKENEFLVINYHGGEPLINFSVIKFITEKVKQYFDRDKILFGITTNGLLLTKEVSDYLAENCRYNLSISLDGDRNTHNFNRKLINGSGTYDLVIDKFLYLCSIRPDIRVRMTYNADTINRLFENIKEIIDMGFKHIVSVPDYSDTRWENSHIEILKKEIKKLYIKYKYTNVTINLLKSDFHIKKGNCDAGIGNINIDCNGIIYPCSCTVSKEEFKIGDIYRGVDNRIVKKYLNYCMQISNVCNGCGLYHWCIGTRCKIVNKVITGDYNKPPEFLCAETNAIYNTYCEMKNIETRGEDNVKNG